MKKVVKTYQADAELAQLIQDAAQSGEKLRIVTGESEYLIQVTPSDDASKGDIWANYDAERARAALRASAGILGGIDADALIEELKAARGQDGRNFWNIPDDDISG